jgi:hypothetical protein
VEIENTPDNLLSYLAVFGGNLIGIEKRYEGHVRPPLSASQVVEVRVRVLLSHDKT